MDQHKIGGVFDDLRLRKASEREALGALLGLRSLIEKAQRILGDHLPPDGPNSEDTINALYGLLDNSKTWEIQAYANEIIRRLG